MSQDPAVFLGTVDAEGRIRLDFPQQQRAYCKRKLAGQCVDVIIAPQGVLKTRLQECGFHAMITPWAKEEGHAIDDLKRDILREVFGEREHLNPITGEVTMVLREPQARPLVQVNAETFKAVVWKRDKAQCRCCGRKVLKSLALVPERGEVHHIHGRGKDLRFEDRAACLLCLGCHEQVTGRVNEKTIIMASKTFRMGEHEYTDARFMLVFKRVA